MEQRKNLTTLAHDLRRDGKIDDSRQREMLALVGRAEMRDWRPLVYVIPWPSPPSRVEEVPADRRASLEMEYIIRDLEPPEFQLVELTP